MTLVTTTCAVPDCFGTGSITTNTDTRENLVKRFRSHGVPFRTGPGWLEKTAQICAAGHLAVERLEWQEEKTDG